MPESSPQGTSGVRYVEITANQAGQRVDNFLLRRLDGVPKSVIYRILRTGQVRVDGRRVKPEYRVRAGDAVRIPPVRLTPANAVAPPRIGERLADTLQKAVLFEDDELLVLDKPSGIPVHSGSGVVHGVIEAMRQLRPDLPFLELVHRLDRDTSGCLLLAKTRPMLMTLHEQLRTGAIEKHYQVLVAGRWPLGERKVELALARRPGSGERQTVTTVVTGRTAVTWFAPLSYYASATLLKAVLETGRTHQIRVHCAHLGHPVAGDRKYGDFQFNRAIEQEGLKRLFLHAASVRIPAVHATQHAYTFTAALPTSLRAVLQRLPGP